MGQSDVERTRAARAVIAAHRAERAIQVEAIIAQIPKEEQEKWPLLPKAAQQAVVVQLRTLGIPLVRALQLMGLSPHAWHNWVIREKERMLDLMKESFRAAALGEIPECLATLIELRDFSLNEETRRKAALDVAGAAGLPLSRSSDGPGGLTLNVTGDNNRLMVLSQRELDDKLDTLASKLGPYAKDLLDEERKRGSEGPRGISGAPPGA